jgi:uncharacterized membrane protein YqaE (UPF0057 family)
MKKLKYIAMFLIPPYAVFKKKGVGFSFFLSFILTLFGYFLGVAHAVIIYQGVNLKGDDSYFWAD